MSAKPVRRWYQFSLRTLLIVMFLASLPPAAHVGYKQYLVAKRLAEMEASFVWLESLGYPQMPNRQPIRVTTTITYNENGAQKTQKDVTLGFLLREDAKSFAALTPALDEITWKRKDREDWPDSDAEFERLDLPRLARMALEQNDADKADSFSRFGRQLSARGELFVLAWACARQGHSAWAIKLYDVAEADKSGDESDKSFRDRLEEDFAYAETWEATVDCGTEIPRPELLRRFRWLQKHFPKSEYAKEVAAKVAKLQAMVVEDEKHAGERKKGLPFQQLSQEEQIAELIFQLRDQNGQQFSQPGWCSVFHTSGLDEASPAHKVVTYGYDAVPQLISALSDRRLTRSVGFHRDFYFSHDVLTVGDAAEQILERITGRSFDTSREESEEVRIAALQKAVQEWHAELVAKGERHCLREAVKRGDQTSVDLAPRLLEKFPDDGCWAILAALPHTRDDYSWHRLVECLGQVHSDLTVPFLIEQSQRDAVSRRLTAARALTELGRTEGRDAMLLLWQTCQPTSSLEGVGPFLVEFGSPEAVDAVTQRFSEMPIDERLETVGKVLRPELEATGADPLLRKALVQLLLTALKDAEVRTGMSGSRGDKSYQDPRVCDMAGYYLNCLDAARFRFELNEQLEVREAARQAILRASSH